MDEQYATSREVDAIAGGIHDRLAVHRTTLDNHEHRLAGTEAHDEAQDVLIASNSELMNRVLTWVGGVAVIVIGAAIGVIFFGPGT
jgi:hypothetical protein